VYVFGVYYGVGAQVGVLLKACMLISCLRRPACLVQAAGQGSLYTVKAVVGLVAIYPLKVSGSIVACIGDQGNNAV
jgi:hypothetical protein